MVRIFQHIADFYNYDLFIVTAAVHRGFGLNLILAESIKTVNLPALGRPQPVYFSFRFCTDLCFR